MDGEILKSETYTEEHLCKPKRAASSNSINSSRKKSLDEDSIKAKAREKGEKRSKRRKGSDTAKKLKKEEFGDAKSNNTSRNSTATPDSELRQDQSDSPVTDDVFEGSNSSQENCEMLSMSSLLKSVLDRQKMILLESDEIQQFLMQHMVKKENCYDGNH